MCEIEKMLREIRNTEQKEAEQFWIEQREKPHENLGDYTLEELREKHKTELKKIYSPKKAREIGILLMGDYYIDGFSSRRNSKKMAELVGNGTEYLDFYGSSCEYFYMRRQIIPPRRKK